MNPPLNKESSRDYALLDSGLGMAFKGLPPEHNIIICFDHWYVAQSAAEGVAGNNMESSMGHAGFYSLPGLPPASPELLRPQPCLLPCAWQQGLCPPAAAALGGPRASLPARRGTCCPSTHAAPSFSTRASLPKPLLWREATGAQEDWDKSQPRRFRRHCTPSKCAAPNSCPCQPHQSQVKPSKTHTEFQPLCPQDVTLNFNKGTFTFKHYLPSPCSPCSVHENQLH